MPTRRHSLKLLAAGAVAPMASVALPTDAPEDPAADFMRKFDVPGLSYTIAKDGRIITTRALGWADLKRKQPLTPDHAFRIASISKPITSVAIFLLIERGKLTLDQPVFGKDGALGGMDGPAGITVHHLLTHTCGGWKNLANDPMFKHPRYDHAKLIAWTIKNVKLTHKPGEHHAYSNFGYCLLGRVIEHASGGSYEEFVRRNVLVPAGAATMRVAKGMQDERFPDEVNYYMDRKPVTFPMNVRRLDAHGGWVGTPAELVKFALHVDGFSPPADLLKKSSLKAMTARTGPNPGYACGWVVGAHDVAWHNGSLPGVYTLLVRTSIGLCYAACANTRADGLGPALDQLMGKLALAT